MKAQTSAQMWPQGQSVLVVGTEQNAHPDDMKSHGRTQFWSSYSYVHMVQLQLCPYPMMVAHLGAVMKGLIRSVLQLVYVCV